MNSPFGYAGQVLVYAAAAAVVGFLSTRPVYHQVSEGQAQIKLMIKHGGARVEDCRKLTVDELSKLPTAQRRPINCSRERSPLAIQLSIDGKSIYEAVLEPTGLSKDGPSKAYKKFILTAGYHVIIARLRDDVRADNYNYEGREETELKPWQNLAIEFDAERGGFIFR